MDFKVDGKTVLVVGGGFEGCRKIQSFLDSTAVITVVSGEFSEGVKALFDQGKICLSQLQIKDAQQFVDQLDPKPDMLLAVTDDSELNVQLVKAAKKVGCMVYCVSDPSLCDFILPAVARVGSVKIAVSTGGRSPAVAMALRQRIEQLVTPEVLLEIELQVYLRALLKSCVADQRVRSKLLSETLNNIDVKQALREGKLYVAKALSLKIVQNTEATMI
jgi:siroheme synthase-like protein